MIEEAEIVLDCSKLLTEVSESDITGVGFLAITSLSRHNSNLLQLKVESLG